MSSYEERQRQEHAKDLADSEERRARRAVLAAKPKGLLCRLGLHRWRDDTSRLLWGWGGWGESCTRCGAYRDGNNR
jgi:hypothetical protein